MVFTRLVAILRNTAVQLGPWISVSSRCARDAMRLSKLWRTVRSPARAKSLHSYRAKWRASTFALRAASDLCGVLTEPDEDDKRSLIVSQSLAGGDTDVAGAGAGTGAAAVAAAFTVVRSRASLVSLVRTKVTRKWRSSIRWRRSCVSSGFSCHSLRVTIRFSRRSPMAALALATARAAADAPIPALTALTAVVDAPTPAFTLAWAPTFASLAPACRLANPACLPLAPILFVERINSVASSATR
mmetsp:Transcript_12066/g.30917  ORF Transcript_12066/g.30917 Transcript_12066/m.30917 type:complete len:244 (+) Transcript_12066:827-1558(+)